MILYGALLLARPFLLALIAPPFRAVIALRKHRALAQIFMGAKARPVY